jgi:hypothetical protein
MVIEKEDIYKALRERGIKIGSKIKKQFQIEEAISFSETDRGSYMIYVEPSNRMYPWHGKYFHVAGQYWTQETSSLETELGIKILELFGNKQEGIQEWFLNNDNLNIGPKTARIYRAKTDEPNKISAAIESVLNLEGKLRQAKKNLVELAVKGL